MNTYSQKGKAKTLNGRPTAVADLNTGLPAGLMNSSEGIWKKIAETYSKLNDVMAGMYTGVGCSGTPPEFHRYSDKDDHSSDSDTDGK